MADMDIADLVEKIRNTPGCRLEDPLGLPIVCEQHVLPEDLKQFYRLCGGATLYEDVATDPAEIVSPHRIVLANSLMLVGLDDEEIAWYKEHLGITWSWYFLADYGNGNYVTIDLSQERLGQCYDSHHEKHAAGNSYVVADSFTELLRWLLKDYDPKGGDPNFRNLRNPFSQ